LLALRLEFVNTGSTRTTVKDLIMLVSTGQRPFMSSFVLEGEMIYQKGTIEMDGSEIRSGETFTNLYKPPLVAEQNVVHAGWVQFYFEGIDLTHVMNGEAHVLMADHNDKLHPTEMFIISPSSGPRRRLDS
jgi:hypothetical protein